MKRWSGGVVVITLAVILIFLYSVTETSEPPKLTQKQSAYSFFHPDSDSVTGKEVRKTVKPRKKARIVNNEGLRSLYSLANFSDDKSKALVLWVHMHPLLSRSDALPDTALGIKEASTAWRELLSTVKNAKFSQFNNGEKVVDKHCPFSVSKRNGTMSSGGIILDIPCGLVEDSSITVVGIPGGGNGSFQIQLVGSRLLGELKPPVVLSYKVNVVPGDNMTEEPFIVQNTWTSDVGWGKEERCPALGSAGNPEVDGLVLCNEQYIRSVGEDSSNASQLSSESTSNVSLGSTHESANFPFLGGSPFTATLWVGIEGFHMTVNGRHETSFAYREKLEPWLVSQVKVEGTLDLLSTFAKDLPVSEDLDMIADVDSLKAPLISKKKLAMVIGVFSTGNNFERRMALRRSWMQYEAVRSGNVAVRFFVGLHKNLQVNIQLLREAETYGDIQLMPFVDYYSLISLKTIAICILGTKILPAKYIMKTDDDAFVRIDQVLSSLNDKPSNGLVYGLISFDSSPHREKDSKWYISDKEWPYDKYPPWAHGPGYVVSHDIAKFVVQGHQERDLTLFKLEDVAMGIWIEQFNKTGHEVNYITDDRFNNAGCESDYILAHYQGPRKVLCLWEKLQKEHKAECCE